MKVYLGGVRGTTPVAAPEFMGFGGESTSFMVLSQQGTAVVIDVGTGIRLLTPHLLAEVSSRELLLLMTHYHFDHVAGFPAFSVLYDREWTVDIAAPVRNGFAAREVISSLLAKPFWPLQISALQAGIHFKALKEGRSDEPFVRHDLEVRWCPAHHMGGCSAYRIDEPATGASVVVATDIEWRESSAEEKQSFLDFCSTPHAPSCLLFDGHFTDGEYEKFRGWGHSTWVDGVEIAENVEAGRLVITHHAPESVDEKLSAMEAEMQAVYPDSMFGRQGTVLDLQ
jgi:phosphoribosyl 1,2-cyclic phosphodiesterase